MLRRTLFLSTLFALTLALTAHAQTPVVEAEADDGTTLWQLKDDGGFVVFGEYNTGTGTIPTEGEGPRLMWHPEKAAFRAGRITDSAPSAWDDANIGFGSMALGFNTTASGPYSTALGEETEANNTWSAAMGYKTIASGYTSIAMGNVTEASGNRSTAMGSGTEASGDYSTAMGWGTIAATQFSLSAGAYNEANQTDDGTLFVVGNGSFSDGRSDALVLDENGDLTIAGTLTESSDRRLKTGIVLLEDSVLDALGEIRPVRYRFREGTGHPTSEQIGLIAQEVQAHFPELVREGADGHLSLSYAKLTAVLVKGLQEQQQEKEALEARVAALERMMQDRSPVAAGATGYAPLLASVLLLLGGAFVLHRRRSAA